MAPASKFVSPSLLALLAAAILIAPAWSQETDSLFGEAANSEGALIGILYDFKQSQRREPIDMNPGRFLEKVSEFIDSGWDEGVLNDYFRVSKAVYSTQLWIPNIKASDAPKAFGVADLVQQAAWMVHYKGQVAAPEDGTYRFLGEADDFIAVAVNSETVLVAPLRSSPLHTKWVPREPSGMWSGREPFLAGDWFDVKAGETIDLDVIVGEAPGGLFRCFLAIQKKGVTYPDSDRAGYQSPPPFQLTETAETQPGTKPWIGVQ